MGKSDYQGTVGVKKRQKMAVMWHKGCKSRLNFEEKEEEEEEVVEEEEEEGGWCGCGM